MERRLEEEAIALGGLQSGLRRHIPIVLERSSATGITIAFRGSDAFKNRTQKFPYTTNRLTPDALDLRWCRE